MAQLVYFPVRGRAEAIRLIMMDNDFAYEEVDAGDNWVEKWKPKMQFGQCPCFIDEDGFQLVQSNAILRHLGRKFGLYGDTDQEAAILDMMNAGVEDIRIQYLKMIYQNYEEGKEPYIKDIPNKLQPFEKLLKPTNGYILGDKISWTDYNLFDLLDINNVLSPGCLDGFPALKAFYESMLKRPGIQKRRDSEEFKKMKINGNGKQ